MSDINDFFGDNDELENKWGTEDSNNSWLDDNNKENRKEKNEDGSVNWMTEDSSSENDGSMWDDNFSNSSTENDSASWDDDFSDNSDENNNDNDMWGDNFSDNHNENSNDNDMWGDYFSDNSNVNNTTNNDNSSNQQNQNDIMSEFRHRFNFNYKQTSLIIAGVCVVIALLLFGLSKIHITSNKNTQQQQKLQNETNQVQQDSTGSQSLTYIPEKTQMNYNDNVIQSSGKIKEKNKYLLGNQVVYDLVLEIPTGTDTVNLHYYCAKDTFDKMYVDNSVTVSYQVVSDHYYSIKTVVAN